MEDETVTKVIELFQERSRKGIEKYGTTLHDNKLTLAQWLQHSLEEHMDNILYTMRALEEIQKGFDPEMYGMLLRLREDEKDFFEKKNLSKIIEIINKNYGY